MNRLLFAEPGNLPEELMTLRAYYEQLQRGYAHLESLLRDFSQKYDQTLMSLRYKGQPIGSGQFVGESWEIDGPNGQNVWIDRPPRLWVSFTEDFAEEGYARQLTHSFPIATYGDSGNWEVWCARLIRGPQQSTSREVHPWLESIRKVYLDYRNAYSGVMKVSTVVSDWPKKQALRMQVEFNEGKSLAREGVDFHIVPEPFHDGWLCPLLRASIEANDGMLPAVYGLHVVTALEAVA